MSVSARLSRLYGRALGELEAPLTFRQYRLLERVNEGHTSLATLAAFGNLTLPTISESVDVLVRRGLFTRRDHPDDRRSVVLRMTPSGEEVLAAGQVAMTGVGRELLRGLSEEARLAMHSALELVYEAATEQFRPPADAGSRPIKRASKRGREAATAGHATSAT